MFTTVQEARGLKTQKAGTPMPTSHNFAHDSDRNDSADALRLQRLRLIGIIGRRATALSGMIWGEAA